MDRPCIHSDIDAPSGMVASALFRTRITRFALAALAIALVSAGHAAAQIPGDSLVLEGNFIRTGVSNNGTLGVGGNTSPGFIFDSTGTGTFDPANDYLTPGSPHEGFSLSYTGSGGLLQNNNAGNTVGIGVAAAPTVVDSGVSGFDHSVVWSGTIASVLNIEHLYGLNDDSKQVVITTTITALTDLDNLLFARWIDPDSGGTSSINTRGNALLGLAPEDWVNSESEVNGATLGLFSPSDVTHNTAISPGWSTDPAFYVAGSGDTVGDHTIGIGFNIGTLLNGNSAVLQYSYAVAADPNDFDFGTLGVWTGAVDSDFDVPENWSPELAATDGDPVRIESGVNPTLNHNVAGNTYTSWTFNADSAQVTVVGNDVTLGDGASLTNESNHLQSFTATVVAAGDLAIDAQSGGLALQNIVVAGGSTLTFDTGTSNANSFSGVISGNASSLTTAGDGTLTLAGNNTYTGATTVGAGRLVVGGSITSHTTVAAGGTLGGAGTISGNVVNNGTLAPGNSIGTLTVDGNFTHAAGADLEIEINDGGQVAGTNNDLVDVSGAATINGGTVQVLAESGNYNAHWKYTFLTAASVTGTFDSITDNLTFLDAVLGYDDDNVHFTLFRSSDLYESIADTPNQLSVGSYLDNISSGATGELQTLLDEINMLSDEEALAAYDQLSGEFHGTLSQIGIQNLTLVLAQLSQRLRASSFGLGGGSLISEAVPELADSPVVLVSYTDGGMPQFQCCDARAGRCRWSGWAMGFGLGGSASSDGNAAGLDYRMGGTMVGIEQRVDRCHRFGFYGGYLGTGLDTDAPRQSGEIHSGHFGGYLAGNRGCHYYSAVAGFQFDQYDTRRIMQIGSVNQVASADYDGWQGFTYLERGLVLRPSCQSALQPYAAAQYIHLRRDGFTETGAGAANLQVGGVDVDSLRSLLGARFQVDHRSRSGCPWKSEARASWVHEYLDTSTVLTTGFAGTGGTGFNVRGLDLGRDWALLGYGLSAQVTHGWRVFGNYDALANDRQVFHVGSGGAEYVW